MSTWNDPGDSDGLVLVVIVVAIAYFAWKSIGL